VIYGLHQGSLGANPPYSMLKASGIGVAMGNAVSQVKDIADYITLSSDEDGVAEYIETYIL
jgi:hydroxymethylpyrimidine pyrophosphatase-like HAD family hydrolase